MAETDSRHKSCTLHGGQAEKQPRRMEAPRFLSMRPGHPSKGGGTFLFWPLVLALHASAENTVREGHTINTGRTGTDPNDWLFLVTFITFTSIHQFVSEKRKKIHNTQRVLPN